MVMTPENFCYWLQGYFEILDAKGSIHDYLSEDQLKTVKDHLKLALSKQTPDRSPFTDTPLNTKTICHLTC